LGYGSQDSWGKISNTRLYDSASSKKIDVLYKLSSRRKTDLNALKLYLYLGCLINKNTGVAEVGYKTINEKTGILNSDISGAISMLLEHKLVSVDRSNNSVRGVIKE
jgi:hypothetical protein